MELDQLGERRDRMTRVALDRRSRPPCGRGRARAAREPCMSPSVTPEYAGCDERALALDAEQLSPALAPFDDEPLGGAGDEVRDDRVDGDAPAGDRDPGLAGRDERRTSSPRRRASRSSSSATVIFPIAQSEPTVSTIFAPAVRFSPVGTLEPGRRLAQVAQLDAVLARPARPARRRRRRTRAARSRRRGRPRSTPSAARARPAGSARPAWRRRRAPSSGRRQSASSTAPTIGTPS